MLQREPLFALGVILTFALAIGVNATMFGVVDRLMLSPPRGVRAPESVERVRIRITSPDGESFAVPTTSYPSFRALQSTSSVFASAAAIRPDTATIGRSPALTQIPIIGASGEFFTLLRARPAIGRFFGAGDDVLPYGNSVIVLGYDYWQRAFGGDASAIGQEVVVNDQPFTIIGIAERGFDGGDVSPVDAYVPMAAALRNRGGDWATNRNFNIVSVVVRLRDGVTTTVAAQAASASLREEASAGGRSRAPTVELESIIPGKAARSSPQARITIWLSAVSLIVLLIATANVGTLFALRSARRRRDVAVRVALGAGRRELVRQRLTECLSLAMLGVAVGLVIARWFSRLIQVVLLPDVARSESFVDMRILLASIAGAIVAALGAGLVPVLQQSRLDVADELRAGGGQGGSHRFALQRALVAVQTALCTLLVVGAGLFIRSLDRVQSQDLGFATASLSYVTLDFREHLPSTERDRLYEEAVRRVRRAPGVLRATVAAGIPFGPHNIPPVSVPGVTWPPNTQVPIMYAATPDYLDAMGVQLVAGRLIRANDGRSSRMVVLVNETMARTIWPGQSPLGKCVRAGFGTFPPSLDEDPSASAPCREVVGVVRDSRARSLRPEHNEDRLMQYYVPFDQIPAPPFSDIPAVMGLVVKSRGDASSAAGAIQHAIQSGSRDHQLFAHVKPYQDLIDPQLRSWRLGATLFSAMGALALAIAAAGLVGVVSYVVTQRVHEIGVRLALGGNRSTVARLIVLDALRMSGVGVGVGAVGALIAGPLVAALLFQTSPRDVATLVASVLVLLGTTVLAAAWPAWRAARVNPVIALRADG